MNRDQIIASLAERQCAGESIYEVLSALGSWCGAFLWPDSDKAHIEEHNQTRCGYIFKKLDIKKEELPVLCLDCGSSVHETNSPDCMYY